MEFWDLDVRKSEGIGTDEEFYIAKKSLEDYFKREEYSMNQVRFTMRYLKVTGVAY